jgi:hypothetical protein
VFVDVFLLSTGYISRVEERWAVAKLVLEQKNVSFKRRVEGNG